MRSLESGKTLITIIASLQVPSRKVKHLISPFSPPGIRNQKVTLHFQKKLRECTEYYNFAYPLFDVPQWREKRIGIIGMGLTAIDTMLYYTENKGGKFFRENKKLAYKPSGNEPAKLFALSRSGYFTYSRPHNFKEVDLQKYEHNGYFYTPEIWLISCAKR